MSDPSGAQKDRASEKKSRYVIFELETVAAQGRQLYFETAQKVMKGHGLDLTPVMFMTYGTDLNLSELARNILKVIGNKKISPDDLATEINDAVSEAFKNISAQCDAGLKAMLEAAEKENMGIAALTGLGRENGEALLERIGLSPDRVTVLSISHPISLKASENQWAKACRTLTRFPGNAIAVATSGDATRAAMAIGLKTVGLPDKFTSCQDFGGADYVVDSLSDINFQDLLALLDVVR